MILNQETSFFVAARFSWAVSNIWSIIITNNNIVIYNYIFWNTQKSLRYWFSCFRKLDFDIATFNGEQTEHGSGLFASSGYWKGTGKRGYMNNLESLVYTIWYIERIHYNQPAGLTIKYNKNNKRFVMVSGMQNFNHFSFSQFLFRFRSPCLIYMFQMILYRMALSKKKKF